ncbi:M23 family metallopeptidase [Paenibacillus sp. IHBB 10380]|uniref:M23 family metallopeptidase n=1 Tax=Paenibacillus sp. IHBB 10380 TaxID=1566358 RepID=UPI0005CFA44D|nr:M23 family metallopeptidase [Paenibacillus sp. IHBB 10380]AJS60344.1 membrane protein [Paenibacillus sp. IHBB 10380]
MKKIASLIAAIILVTMIFQPNDGYAKQKTVKEVEHELKLLQQQAKKAAKVKEKVAAKKEKAQHYKNKTNNNLDYVLEQITVVSNKLEVTSMKIEDTKEKLTNATTELNAAEERIASREVMLESRVRLMYTDGAVSYLDVLLSSSSFSDFLDRADTLKTIVDQDQNLLDEHKKDKVLVLDKKKELEVQYATAEGLYSEMETQKSILDEKEQEKHELIAMYDEQIQESDELNEEQEQKLVALATKRSALQREKNKLVAAEEAARAKAAKEAAAKREAAAREAAAREAAKREAAAKEASRSATSRGSSNNSAPSASFIGNGGPLLLPVGNSRVSSGYGPRTHPVTGQVGKKHTGIDFAVPQGTSVHAAESGTVIMAEWFSGYGNAVIVDHGGGMWTLYGHLRNGGFNVREGDRVSRGEKIAESGSTGQSTGPHLHFEVRINGSTVNPAPYL